MLEKGFIALLGAFLVFAIRFVVKWSIKCQKNSKPRAIYYCYDQFKGKYGGMSHSHGRVVADELAVRKKSWQHSKEPIDGVEGAVLFGPYTNDFGKTGEYRVIFRIYSRGYKHEDDSPVLVLDVARLEHVYDFLRGQSVHSHQVPIAQKIVRANELAKFSHTYYDFELKFSSPGDGTFEYRCVVRKFEEGVHVLRFDTIKVYGYMSIENLVS